MATRGSSRLAKPFSQRNSNSTVSESQPGATVIGNHWFVLSPSLLILNFKFRTVPGPSAATPIPISILGNSIRSAG